MRTVVLLSLALLAACEKDRPPVPPPPRERAAEQSSGQSPEDFRAYWNAGKAEITHFALQQARYGEVRRGDALLIFVTEDFLPDKQVKAERPASAAQAVPILKLNLAKEFNTGIYRYSLMTSVFTPVDRRAHPRTLKTATSSQEWCGMTYVQLNLRGERYELTGHSYFENEADQSYALPAALLEDEIWTLVRITPESLPVGDVRLIPGALASRLRHRPLRVEVAKASLGPGASADLSRYAIEYPESKRTLSIEFRKAFPHEIASFEETYLDGFGSRAKVLTTRGEKTHLLRTAYWKHNANSDLPLRTKLGLR
jgi:hypothetical protein